ncbi:MAG: family 78 glycoside hydrolase catalytic domain [Pirellulaceae bacterium]
MRNLLPLFAFLGFCSVWHSHSICQEPAAVYPTWQVANAAISTPQLSKDGRAEFEALLDRGYTPLFNGSNLTGWWNPYSHGEARVVDGEIRLEADKKFFLVTRKRFSDFRLCVEIHLPEGEANSGVMFRCHVDEQAKKKVYGYQAECDGSDRRWSGGFYDESRRGWIWPSTKGRSTDQFLQHEKESKADFAKPQVRAALRRNGWNRYIITCVKDLITIELNGVQTVRFRDATDAVGHIGIQHHGEKGQTYRFRNLFIKELPEIPAEEHCVLTEQEPVSVKRVGDKVTLVDFGKAAFGNIVMPVPKAGRGTASVHFGERLENGRIDRAPRGTIRYGVTQIRVGQQRGNWVVPAPVDPRNIEQAGLLYANPPAVRTPQAWGSIMPFRWVEIEGLEEDFPYELVRRRAAFSKTWNDNASKFECSDETLNRIWELCKYSIKATTFAGIYVDGDRERIPYEADAYLNQLSHYYTDDRVQMAGNTFDWLMDNGTWPTEWAPHMVLMAYAEWMHSGDREWLQHRYEYLKTKTLLDRSRDDGLVTSDANDRNRNDLVDWPKKERDGFVFTEVNTVVNAFHQVALLRMAEMARALDKKAEAQLFQARFKLANQSMQKKLFDPTRGIYVDGLDTPHSSIHSLLFPLAFGLVPTERIDGVVDWLKRKEMDCSVYASQYLLEALFEHGGDSEALALIAAEGDRSWKHMLQSGTTITWEAWDLKYKPNLDWNHAWGAAPANLFPRFILGIQPQDPGWRVARIRPTIGHLDHAKGQVPTPRGGVNVEWRRNGAELIFEFQLPAGVKARLDLPAPDSSQSVYLNGEAAEAKRVNSRWILAGEHEGSIKLRVK